MSKKYSTVCLFSIALEIFSYATVDATKMILYYILHYLYKCYIDKLALCIKY